MAARKKKAPPEERLTWSLEFTGGNKFNDPYPTLTKQYLINQDRDYILDRQHNITVRGDEIQIKLFLKSYWTIDQLITTLQIFQASCNADHLSIETYQEPYDDGYSAQAFFRGWRQMTAEELAEANDLRKMTKQERDEHAQRQRAMEIERAQQLLRQVGLL